MQLLRRGTMRVMARTVHCLVFIFMLVAGSAGAEAQALVLRELDAAPVLNPQTANPGRRYYVNGPMLVGAEGLEAEELVPLGRASKLLLTFAVLRLVDQGMLSLDTPLHMILPDLIEDNPFEPPVRVSHLLAETAGYAVPPWYPLGQDGASMTLPKDGTLDPYLITLRYAGRMHHDDVVAGALMSETLKVVSGQDIMTLLAEQVLAPLGLDPDHLDLDTNSGLPDKFAPVLGLKATRALLKALARQLYDRPRQRLLSASLQPRLVERTDWTLHPLSLTRTLGLERRIVAGHRLLLLEQPPCSAGVTLAALPAQDLVFIEEYVPDDLCKTSTFLKDIAALVRQQVPPGQWGRRILEQAQSLSLPTRLSGFYVQESLPRASLSSRLGAIYQDTVFLKPDGPSGRFEFRRGPEATRYQPTGPLVWTDQSGTREGTLVLSPIGGHGYFYRSDGTLYRYIGLLGDMRLVLSPLPWMLILIASGGLQIFNRTDKAWRRMGVNALVGTILFGGGLSADLNGWQWALYELEAPWLIVLWRLLLNIGLSLMLSVTLYGFYIAKRKDLMPIGVWLMPCALHLTVLTAAPLILFLLTVAWGVAGTITPY